MKSLGIRDSSNNHNGFNSSPKNQSQNVGQTLDFLSNEKNDKINNKEENSEPHNNELGNNYRKDIVA